MVDTFLVAVIQALGCDSSEIFAVNILCVQSVDVTLIPWDVLPL